MSLRGARCGVAVWLLVAFAGLLAWTRPAQAAPASGWAEAQARQADALRSERETLDEALATSRASTEAAKADLTGEIERLSQELTRLRVESARLEASLPERERQRSAAGQGAQLSSLLERLGELAPGVAGPEPEEAVTPDDLPRRVEAMLRDIRARSQLWLDSDGEYFDHEGKLVRGPVVHLGRVAAVRWDDAAVPLVASPAGLQRAAGVEPSRVVMGDRVVTRGVLFDPEAPTSAPVFEAPGWRAKMDQGGPIMWVLLVLGLAALAVVIERAIGLLWARARWAYDLRRFEAAVREHRTASLLPVDSWIAKPLVIAAAARCPSCATPQQNDVEEGATQALMVMRERLQRRLSLIHVTAGIAPLLGLLGTVTGMIHTFSVVTNVGTSEPQQLAGGISEALLTTQLGLVVAIPAFLAHALLSRAARRILANAEQSVLWFLHGAGPVVETTGGAHEH